MSTIPLSPTAYEALRRTLPKREKRHKYVTKRRLERLYYWALERKFTEGYRAAQCATILRIAEEEGITLDPLVRLGCRLFVLAEERRLEAEA